MKKLLVLISIISFPLIGVYYGCNEIQLREVLEPFEPTNLDEAGGDWKMILLSDNEEIPVNAPLGVESPEYKAELAALKNLQEEITDKERAAITYWSSGSILRWNQILRELVAKYNLPPAPNADGTYPAPSAANPFNYPQFPFANPPYSARAYSYVSTAVFDALKSAWHYKYLYKRPAPAKVDNQIKALAPITILPAYPSEDAVIAGVQIEMLKLLFPAEVNYLNTKVNEHTLAAQLAGKAVASDIAAGLALGKGVAAKFVARARGDGMGNAAGTPTIWTSFEEETAARGEIPWVSQEIPSRPPMLPLFGKVKAWMLTPEQIINERPAPPPSTGSDQMMKELTEVKKYSEDYDRDRMAIVHFWADGVGTPTPPGHWNAIAAELVAARKLNELRTARVLALVNMALHDAAVGCWETKYFYFNPRPSQLDPEIKTSTGLPNFPAYTSGHSTFSAAASTVLSYIFPDEAIKLDAMAQEASLSRIYGAIHYRSDCEMGLAHGKVLGEYTIRWAKTDGSN